MAGVRVLVVSADATYSALIRLNLERRGYPVVISDWAACCGPDLPDLPSEADAVVADLDCPVPVCWNAAPRLRNVFPEQPLLLLVDSWPSPTRLRACEPCVYLRKPVAVGDLVSALRALLPSEGA